MIRVLFIVFLFIASPVFAKTVICDFTGTSVDFEKPPNRVVALMPALAEILIELDTADRLIGAPEYTNLPTNSSSRIDVLGPYTQISLERVVALKPDIVLASIDGNSPLLVRDLRRLNIKTLVFDTSSLAEIVRTTEILQQVLGIKQNENLRRLREIAERAAQVRQSSVNVDKLPTVFIEIGWNPLVAAGPKTFIDDVVTAAGGRNFLKSSKIRYPRPNAEEVLALDPDIIIICQLTKDRRAAEEAANYWRRFKRLHAAKNSQIQIIAGDSIAKPGFSLVKGYEILKPLIENAVLRAK